MDNCRAMSLERRTGECQKIYWKSELMGKEEGEDQDGNNVKEDLRVTRKLETRNIGYKEVETSSKVD